MSTAHDARERPTVGKRLERLGKLALAWLVAALFPRRRSARPAVIPDRVLVLRPDDRVGDLLLTTPLFAALARLRPDVRIDVVAPARLHPLVAGLPNVGRLHPYDRHWATRAPGRLVGLVRALRAERYALCFDATHWHTFSFTGAWLARASGAAHVVAHARGPTARLADTVIDCAPVGVPAAAERLASGEGTARAPWAAAEVAAAFAAEPGEVARKLGLLAPFGPPGEAPAPRCAAGLGDAGPCAPAPVVLIPAARKAERRLPPQWFGALAATAARLGVDSLVVWGPGDEPCAQAVLAAAPGAARLAPPTDLDALAWLVRRARVVVVGDSGPLHLAAATSTPTLGLLAAPDWARWAPRGPGHHAIPVGVPPRPAALAAACAALEAILATPVASRPAPELRPEDRPEPRPEAHPSTPR